MKITKTCSICKEEKPLREFHRNQRTMDGFNYWCKKCNLEKQRINRRKNIEYCRKYREKNRLSHKKYYREIYRLRIQKKREEIFMLNNHQCSVCGKSFESNQLQILKDGRVVCRGFYCRHERKWARDYSECVKCKSIKYRHVGYGLCSKCYEKKRKRYKQKWRSKKNQNQ